MSTVMRIFEHYFTDLVTFFDKISNAYKILLLFTINSVQKNTSPD